MTNNYCVNDELVTVINVMWICNINLPLKHKTQQMSSAFSFADVSYFSSLYCKQYRTRSDYSLRSSLIRVHSICFHDNSTLDCI